MEVSLKDTYLRFYNLIRSVESHAPLLTNLEISLSFNSKLRSLEIMQKYTIKTSNRVFASYLKEKDGPNIFPVEVIKYLPESIAFFEAYLNAFYSLLQIIAKVTPYFYDQKKLKKKIPNDYFDWQKNFFIKNKDIDSDYAEYLESKTSWYDDLVCNRHAVSHNVSAFLGFGKEHMEFIHMPKKRLYLFESGKPTKNINEYVESNWSSLFAFLEFYEKHFCNKLVYSDPLEELEEMRKLVSEKTA